MNEHQLLLLASIANSAQDLVWWKPEQQARGEHLENNPTKGERPWIIPEATGRFLYETIIKNNSTSVLELGTSIGYSTIWIAYALEITQGSIHTIERSVNKIPIAQKNFEDSLTTGRITLHNDMILSVLENFEPSLMFDCVFLDADRGHYHEYFPIIKKHLLPGAVIIADNASNMNARMQPFLNLLTNEGWEWTILEIDNGILVTTYPVEDHNN